MQIPRSRLEKLKVRDQGPVHLTEGGLKDLKDKLARLKESLPKLATDAKTAADYGDRSENAEYQAAKSKLRGTHRQILSLEDQIRRASVIKSGPNTSGKVQLGSIVVIEENGSATARAGQAGSPRAFQIVGPSETEPTNGRISYQSPLGAALLGHEKGDSVTFQTGAVSKTYTILEVK
ncbi:MAG: transcription elongation factor GreA [Parcubacteria group bacterium Gr01-1014_3]|nr:MAG: transcription elongation factor GreA [Parcubacteria group bacterium Gr01-1014_3]